MTITLIIVMLLVWIALGVYGDDAPVGCLMLSAALPMFALLLALALLVWASTLGRKAIRVHVEDV